jgi:outer membrane murein-binding lipoprotein Lpp
MSEQEQLTRILTLVELTNSRLDQLDRDIKETNNRIQRDIKDTNQRIEEEVKRWDERFFQLVKEQGQTARTIIIAAASVVVLSRVLGSVIELVNQLLSR